MSITIQADGRRFYLVGETYPHKGAIKAAGCSWDPARGAWWTGKRDVAEAIVTAVAAVPAAAECRWVKLPVGFGVLVPAATAAAPGTKVRVSSREGGVKEVELAALVETRADGGRVYAVLPRQPVAAKSSRRSNWRPCGYPGCNPNYCDECDGEGLKLDYRPRRFGARR